MSEFSSFSNEDINLAVKKGSTWLDKNYPSWASSIKLKTLQMGSCSSCIIGQAIGYFDDVLHDLGYNYDWAAENGFSVPAQIDENGRYDGEATDEYYDRLENTWKNEVTNRRS